MKQDELVGKSSIVHLIYQPWWYIAVFWDVTRSLGVIGYRRFKGT